MMAAPTIGAKRAGGFALMLAVFMIVTLAAIGVYLVTISTGQLAAATQDEQGARAYQAARAGLEWGTYQLLCNPSNPQCVRPASAFLTNCNAGAATQPALPLGPLGGPVGGIGYFSRVECTKVGTETEGTISVSVYLLTATGCNNSTCPLTPAVAGYVERQLQLTLTR
jgi:MSHA biogenesis protein MshP